ncbi:MAG: STAS domain-containing protein, partial [Candidatus Muiribacteriota bacterium]
LKNLQSKIWIENFCDLLFLFENKFIVCYYFHMLKIEIENKENIYYINLAGDIDYNYEVELKSRLETLFSSVKTTVIDLKDVHYIDSIGLSIMTYYKKQLMKYKKKLYFYRPYEQIKKVFLMTRFDQIIPIIETEDEFQKIEREG